MVYADHGMKMLHWYSLCCCRERAPLSRRRFARTLLDPDVIAGGVRKRRSLLKPGTTPMTANPDWKRLFQVSLALDRLRTTPVRSGPQQRAPAVPNAKNPAADRSGVLKVSSLSARRHSGQMKLANVWKAGEPPSERSSIGLIRAHRGTYVLVIGGVTSMRNPPFQNTSRCGHRLA